MADEAGLPEVKRGEVAIVATELATNLARYGARWPSDPGNVDRIRLGLEMMTIDGGPGMADVQKCLQDGFSPAGRRATASARSDDSQPSSISTRLPEGRWSSRGWRPLLRAPLRPPFDGRRLACRPRTRILR